MTDGSSVRLWLGWRTPALTLRADGWRRFIHDLAETFIPATCEVMRGYGLRAYLPSVLTPTQGAGPPEEVALLCYDDEGDAGYGRHRKEVRGRGYAVMHRALFDFETPGRRSRSDWARVDAVADKPLLRAAAAGGPGFADADARVHVVVLRTGASLPAGAVPPAASLLGALAAQPGRIAAWAQPGFAVLWLAARTELDETAIVAPLLAAAPGLELVALHHARPAPVIDQLTGVPVVEGQSWHFVI